MSAETDLVGAIVLWPETLADVRGIVGSEDFEEPTPRAIFAACCAEDAAKRTWTFNTLAEVLASGKPQERAGWTHSLVELGEAAISSAYALTNAKLIHAAATRRRLHATLRAALADLDETPATEDAVADFGATLLADLTALVEKGAILSDRNAGDVMLDALARLRSPEARGGIDTGLSDLDNVLLGLRAGNVYVFAGRPGMGKSALGQQLAINAAKDGHQCTFVSCEMPEDEVGDRSLCVYGNVDSDKVRGKDVEADKLAELDCDARQLQRAGKLRIVAENYITFAKLRAILRRHKRKHALEIAVLDYLQIVRVTGYRPSERQMEVTEVARSLKQLAKELQIPIIALAQLGREAEGQKPTLAHLRESGAIENEADVVVLLSGERAGSKVIADIAKNRQGRTENVELAFLRASYRVELPERWHSEPINP